MKADIIVLTYGNEDLSCRCFRALRKHTVGYRLIWVDNGSGPRSIDMVWPEAMACAQMVPMFLSQNEGFIGGTNAALRLLLEVFNTDADYVALLNNDVEISEGWLDRMSRVMERDHTVMAVGPVTSECASWQSFMNARCIVPAFQVPAGFERLDSAERASRLDYCYGELGFKCNMLAFFCTVFRTEVFRKLGYLDERFGIGLGDDDDLCKRMHDENMKLALSMGTYVFHNHGATFQQMFSDEEIIAMRKERLATYREKHGEDAKV